MTGFDVRQYWEKRLSTISLDSVGHRGLGEKYNSWLYKMKKRQLENSLNKHHIAIEGKSILDIGSGSGFYIDFWRNKGASNIVGIDITKAAVRFLRGKYRQYSFHRCDISASDAPRILQSKFDIVSAFDMLYHIVHDDKFETALKNISSLCHQGGHFLLSDIFMQHNPTVSSYYIKNRLLKDYEEVIQDEGFEILAIVPVFHIMISPSDPRNTVEAEVYDILCYAISRVRNISSDVAARAAYMIDLFLNIVSSGGPSTKIMICKKRS